MERIGEKPISELGSGVGGTGGMTVVENGKLRA